MTRWAAAAAVAVVAAAFLSTGAGADGNVTTSPVTVTITQNGTGINVCAPGATCNQNVQVLNFTVVYVSQGAPPPPALVTIWPVKVNFGSLRLGATATRRIALYNRGGTPAIITGTTVSASNAVFTVQPGSCGASGPISLMPGHSCALFVVFHPKTLGPQTATLGVSASGNTLSASIFGTGVVAAPPHPAVTVASAAAADSPASGAAPLATPPTGAAGGGAQPKPRVPRYPLIEAHPAAAPPQLTGTRLADAPAPASATSAPTASRESILWLLPPLAAAALTLVISRAAARRRRTRKFGLLRGD